MIGLHQPESRGETISGGNLQSIETVRLAAETMGVGVVTGLRVVIAGFVNLHQGFLRARPIDYTLVGGIPTADSQCALGCAVVLLRDHG